MALKRKDVLSLAELIAAIEGCFTAEGGLKPAAALVEHVCDYKRWLTGVGDYEDPGAEDLLVPVEETMSDEHTQQQQQGGVFQATPQFTDISNTSYHHQFKIFKNDAGKVTNIKFSS